MVTMVTNVTMVTKVTMSVVYNYRSLMGNELHGIRYSTCVAIYPWQPIIYYFDTYGPFCFQIVTVGFKALIIIIIGCQWFITVVIYYSV